MTPVDSQLSHYVTELRRFERRWHDRSPLGTKVPRFLQECMIRDSAFEVNLMSCVCCLSGNGCFEAVLARIVCMYMLSKLPSERRPIHKLMEMPLDRMGAVEPDRTRQRISIASEMSVVGGYVGLIERLNSTSSRHYQGILLTNRTGSFHETDVRSFEERLYLVPGSGNDFSALTPLLNELQTFVKYSE